MNRLSPETERSAMQTENRRLQGENKQLRVALADVQGIIADAANKRVERNQYRELLQAAHDALKDAEVAPVLRERIRAVLAG